MAFIGIDIGSTCSKTAVLDKSGSISDLFVIPTGWSSLQALEDIREELSRRGVDLDVSNCISTGYGRKAVQFALRQVTEISCHAKGAAVFFQTQPSTSLMSVGRIRRS